MKFLLLSLFSVLFIGCSSVKPVIKRNSTAVSSESTVWKQALRSETSVNYYHAKIVFSDNSITGDCLIKKNGNEWRGTFMNEMKVKAFDFIVTDNKCELLNVIPAMDKWYIKKTVADDLYYLINVDNPNASFHKKTKRFEQDDILVVNFKKKQILAKPDNSILLMNNRRNLQYELRIVE